MIICGLKLTHDGAIALIKDNELVFCIEMEKINNNLRYTGIEETEIIQRILNDHGYDLTDIDYFAIDGWGGDDQEALAIQPRLEIGEGNNRLSAFDCKVPYQLNIGLYEEKNLKDNVLQVWKFSGLKVNHQDLEYSSFLHVAGHIMSAYCTSDFARKNESSYILIWDGGMYPRLYFFDAKVQKIENLGPIFLLIGNMYSIFSQYFGPFKVKGNFAKDSLSVAGKVMAYIALGKNKLELFPEFDDIYTNHYTTPMGFANIFANEFKRRIQDKGYLDEDILLTFHKYLEKMLSEKLQKKISRFDKKCRNLVMAGGCALNIKWNSAIRDSGLFDQVFVPPFPNDSGSAIGAACCAMFLQSKNSFLNWNVYRGPQIIKNEPAEGWITTDCSIKELAQLLYGTNEPVVFLNDKAELGPRALGNRSIIATAIHPKMKDLLNEIKVRESYRPVSPICLEDKAPTVFTPGNKDPFMLFDHQVKEAWLKKIPAVCHLDDSARLQTVNHEQNPIFYELLTEYELLSGIPLLCNTSANYKGSGFFPDVYSVTKWDKVNYVWCSGSLYTRQAKHSFDIL